MTQHEGHERIVSLREDGSPGLVDAGRGYGAYDTAPLPRRSPWKRAALWVIGGIFAIVAVALIAATIVITAPLLGLDLGSQPQQQAPRAKPADPIARPADLPPAPEIATGPADVTAETGPPAAEQLPLPDPTQTIVLIRTALNALNQANQTNNYSIFREQASFELQRNNSGAGISASFSDLRNRNVDMSAINVTLPELARNPFIDERGLLRLAGRVPTRPEAVAFNLGYRAEDGQWRLFEIAVNTVPPGDEQAADSPGPPVQTRATPGKQPTVNRQPELPDPPTMLALIRQSVFALDQANKANNYSILLEIGSPGFQQGNTHQSLSQAFADLRSQNLDMRPILTIRPNLYEAAAIKQNGYLRLKGYFPGGNSRINFDLAFQQLGNEWKLFGIGVALARSVPDQPASQQPAAQQGASPRQLPPIDGQLVPASPVPKPRP